MKSCRTIVLVCFMALALAVLLLSCVDGTPTATPTATATPVGPIVVWTQLTSLERQVSVVETLVAETWYWTGVVGTKVASEPTCTPQPTVVLCRRCIPGSFEYGCPEGYFCKECGTCKMLCVRNIQPNADCAFCLTQVIP